MKITWDLHHFEKNELERKEKVYQSDMLVNRGFNSCYMVSNNMVYRIDNG